MTDYRRAQDVNRYPLSYGEEEQIEAAKVPRRDYRFDMTLWCFVALALFCFVVAEALAISMGLK